MKRKRSQELTEREDAHLDEPVDGGEAEVGAIQLSAGRGGGGGRFGVVVLDRRRLADVDRRRAEKALLQRRLHGGV